MAAVTLLALALRLYGIGGPSFKLWDDFFALRLAVKDFTDILHALRHQPFDAYQEFQPPLYYLLVHAFLAFGKTDAMARLTGVLAGTLTVPALYLLGARLLGRATGLVGALLLAVSLYHIEYSQQIRNYVPFLCLATWAMAFFAAWITDRDLRALPGYCLATAGMLWMSYMSTVAVAAQMAIWLAFVVPAARGGVARAIKDQWPLVAVATLAGASFLPWLSTYRNIVSALTGITGNQRPPTLETLTVTLREFSSYYCEVLGYPDVGLAVLALALCGIALALLFPGLALDRAPGLGANVPGAKDQGGNAAKGLTTGRDWSAVVSTRRGAAFLLLWAGVTLLFVLGFNRQGLHVRTRHLIAILPVLLLFAAHPLAITAGRFKRPLAGAALVLAAVVALNAFNFRALPFFYLREDDRLKELCWEMASFARDTGRQFFWGSDSKWFPDVNETVVNWYLPGAFKRPGQDFSKRYMRAWMVYPAGTPLPLASAVPVGKRGYARYALAGVVNTSPVVAAPGPDGSFVHSEEFASPASYGLLDGLDNLHLDRGRAILIDPTKPGFAEWAFAAPTGQTLTDMRLEIEADFLTDISGVPDSALTVYALNPGGSAFLGRFALKELAAAPGFAGNSLSLRRELAVPEAFAQGSPRIRIELDPGRDLGVVELKRFAFSARAAEGAPPARTPGRMRLEHALANTPVAQASAAATLAAGGPGHGGAEEGMAKSALPGPGGVKGNGAAVPMGQALYAFTTLNCDPLDPGRIGGAAALEAFRKAYPGLGPVLSIEDGEAVYHLFDPALAAPSLAVPGRYPLAGARAEASGQTATASPPSSRSLAAWGLAADGGVRLDGASVPLATAWNEPAYVDVDTSGRGRLIVKPLFVKGGPPAPGAFEASGVKQAGAEDCLTCVDEKPCAVTYRFRAPGGFTELSVRWHPRVRGDWKLKNALTLEISTDGREFDRLDGLYSNASGRWDGWRVGRFAGKKWTLPARDIYLRFLFSGDGAQLWSSAEFPLTVVASFPATAGAVTGGVAVLDASGERGRAQLLDAAPRDYKHLLQTR